MARLRHENVLPLIGICLVDDIKMIMPLRLLGSLEEFLKKEKNSLDAGHLMSYCYQIASGMEYLASKGIVHRDLATRNVLMRKKDEVEVADFGLAKMIDAEISNLILPMPIRWAALECLIGSEFSETSDVWSFGVTCWEIITFSQHKPYSKCKLEERKSLKESLIDFLSQGGRLISEAGDLCTIEFYKTLLLCWMENPEARPKFEELKKFFSLYLSKPEDLIPNVHPTSVLDKNLDSEGKHRELINELLGDDNYEYQMNKLFKQFPNVEWNVNKSISIETSRSSSIRDSMEIHSWLFHDSSDSE